MIASVAEIRASEEYTMRKEPISSLDLMERAGCCFVEKLCKTLDLSSFSDIYIFCGPGNNGGDGLVIGRLLSEMRYPVYIFLCNEDKNTTSEHQVNLKRLQESSYANLTVSDYRNDFYSPGNKSLVIDALFGIGISKPLSSYYADIVQAINQRAGFVVSVDVPSGLFPDQHTPERLPCVQAAMTFTFQFQKLAYLFPENEYRVGNVITIDIGLLVPPEQKSSFIEIEKEDIRKLLIPPSKFAHKGSNGLGMLIAGSLNMPGAAILAAKGALRGGIGKLVVHSPASVARLIPLVIPEVVTDADQNDSFVSKINWERYPNINALAIGPGIGTSKATSSMISSLLDEIHSPMLLDADALNILAENKTWLAYLPERSILTPHLKEFERLAGKPDHDFDRLERARRFAQRYRIILVLKGANTAIAMPDGKVFFNTTTGNPGMAKAGSGDVLTGLLLALLAKGYTPEIAAIIGVYIHGLAGDLTVEYQESMESLIASDIAEHIGKAFKTLY